MPTKNTVSSKASSDISQKETFPETQPERIQHNLTTRHALKQMLCLMFQPERDTKELEENIGK